MLDPSKGSNKPKHSNTPQPRLTKAPIAGVRVRQELLLQVPETQYLALPSANLSNSSRANTITSKTLASCLAAKASSKPNQALKIPVLKTFTPKYCTVP